MTKRERYTYIVIGVFSMIAFLLLSLMVNKDIFRSLDYDIMTGLQNRLSRKIDIPFSVVTLLGSMEITLTVLAVTGFFIFIKFKHAFWGLSLYFLIMLVELGSKIFIYHPKPPKTLLRYALNIHFPTSSLVDTHFSFPSGHMARTTFLSAIIIFIIMKTCTKGLKKSLYILFLIILVIVTFISRIYLGEHWLSDVAGGLILGFGIAALSMSFW